MPRKRVWAEHGTVRRYNQGGCDDLRGGSPGAGDHCTDCVAAKSEANKRKRAGYKTPHPNNVTSIVGHMASNTNRIVIGANERATALELEPYIDTNPGQVQWALTLARELDNPERGNNYAQLVNQVRAITKELTATKKSKVRGRLAAVKRITR